MLKKISIQNFQSHKKTELDLVDGINVIYGLSQSGKSAILRALNWIIFNRPSGYRFHSHFSDEPTKVSVEIDDSQVSYIKSDKETNYKLDKKKFSSFGTSIPNDIRNLFNLSSINFANQIDPPFLVTSTPGEIGKIFNQITKAEQVDLWISKLTTKINKSNTIIELTQQDKDKTFAELSKLSKLDEIEPLMKKFSKVEERMESLTETVSNVEELFDEYQSIKSQIKLIKMAKIEKIYTEFCETFDGINNHERIIKQINDLSKGLNDKKEISTTLNKILPLFEKFETVLKSKKEKEDQINKLEKIKRVFHDKKLISTVLKKITPSLEECEKILKDKNQKEIQLNKLKQLHSVCLEKETLKKNLEKEAGLFSTALKKLGKCPVCMSIIDAKTIKKIEKDVI